MPNKNSDPYRIALAALRRAIVERAVARHVGDADAVAAAEEKVKAAEVRCGELLPPSGESPRGSE